MTSLNTRERLLIYAVILLASGFLLYRFVISPELKLMSAARFHSNSQQELLKTKAEEIQHHSVLNDMAQRLRERVTETTRILFSREEAVDFLRLLPQLTSQTGSVLIGIYPRYTENFLTGDTDGNLEVKTKTPEEGDVGSYMRMPVQIAIRGRYSEIVRFLEQLEEREQLMTVSEFHIETASESPAEVNAGFVLNLYVYEHEEI